MHFNEWNNYTFAIAWQANLYVNNIVNSLIYMGEDLESIMSKPVRALSGCFQLRRPTVCISSMLNGKPGPCFLPINIFLSIFIDDDLFIYVLHGL